MSDDKKVPSIPAVRAEDPNVQRVLEAVKSLLETREGLHDPLDKAITLRDLVSLGVAEVNLQRYGKNIQATVQPTVTGGEDASWASIPPPEVVSFSAVGGFASIILDWESPTYSNHAYTEIWRASALESETAPGIGDAVMVAQVSNGPYSDIPPASNDARVFYYWARNVSTSGLKSGYSDPASAMLATDPGYILSVLLGTPGSEYVDNTSLLVEVPTATTVNGVYVPAGVYIRDLFVQNGTITNAKIADLAVDDAKISEVTASKITTGTLEVGRTVTVDGAIMGGKNAYGSSTAGFWIGKDSGAYRFAIGNASNYMRWTGTQLVISGNLTASTIDGGTVTGSEFIGGSIRYGKSGYTDDANQGYYLGVYDFGSGDVGVFNLGDLNNYIKWDGGTLQIKGDIDGATESNLQMTNVTADQVVTAGVEMRSPIYTGPGGASTGSTAFLESVYADEVVASTDLVAARGYVVLKSWRGSGDNITPVFYQTDAATDDADFEVLTNGLSNTYTSSFLRRERYTGGQWTATADGLVGCRGTAEQYRLITGIPTGTDMVYPYDYRDDSHYYRLIRGDSRTEIELFMAGTSIDVLPGRDPGTAKCWLRFGVMMGCTQSSCTWLDNPAQNKFMYGLANGGFPFGTDEIALTWRNSTNLVDAAGGVEWSVATANSNYTTVPAAPFTVLSRYGQLWNVEILRQDVGGTPGSDGLYAFHVRLWRDMGTWSSSPPTNYQWTPRALLQLDTGNQPNSAATVALDTSSYFRLKVTEKP